MSGERDLPFGLSWREHLPIMITAALSLITVTNIVSAAGWRISTALALLQSAGSSSVVVGALIATLPYIIFALCATFLSLTIWGYVSRDTPRGTIYRWTGSILSILFAAILLPVLLLCLLLIPIVGGVVYGLRDRSADVGAATRRISRKIFTSFLVSPAILVLFGNSIWLPKENLYFVNGQAGAAYVVSADPTDLVLLTSDQQRLIYTSNAELEKRQPCVSKSLFSLTLPDLLARNGPPVCLGPVPGL